MDKSDSIMNRQITSLDLKKASNEYQIKKRIEGKKEILKEKE
jgi:hypothetical protein